MKTNVQCPKCGKMLEQDEKSGIFFCPSCGSKYRGNTAAPQAARPAARPAAAMPYSPQPGAQTPVPARTPYGPPAQQGAPMPPWMQNPQGGPPAKEPETKGKKGKKGKDKPEKDQSVVPASHFDGNSFQNFGTNLLIFLLCIITLGLYYPWGICRKERWICKHTLIEGVRLEFTGRGAQLIGRWILWCFLTLITVGIYGFVIHVRVLQWVTKHTRFHRATGGEARQ